MTAAPGCRLVDTGELRRAFEAARDDGTGQTNLRLPDEPWQLAGARITCVAELTDASDGAAAVVAARRGADLVVAIGADVPPAVVRDLARRCGLHRGSAPPADPRAVLNDDQVRLLELLASGLSVPAAAGQLFLSVRTAERRLGAAKRLLGTKSTAEAVMMMGRPA